MYRPIVFRDNVPGHCGVGATCVVSSWLSCLGGGKEYPTRLDLVSIDACLDNRDGTSEQPACDVIWGRNDSATRLEELHRDAVGEDGLALDLSLSGWGESGLPTPTLYLATCIHVCVRYAPFRFVRWSKQ